MTGRSGAIEREPKRAEQGEVEYGMYIFAVYLIILALCAKKLFCVLCFRGVCLRVCLLQKFLTGYGGAVEREEEAVELGAFAAIRIGFEGKGEVGLVVVVVIVIVAARIIICGLLIGLVFEVILII